MDSRGVPIDLENYLLSCFESDDEAVILGFKQLNLNIKSQFSIVQEEREAMTYLLTVFPDVEGKDNGKISNILDNPTLGRNMINSVCGHVIGVYDL